MSGIVPVGDALVIRPTGEGGKGEIVGYSRDVHKQHYWLRQGVTVIHGATGWPCATDDGKVLLIRVGDVLAHISR